MNQEEALETVKTLSPEQEAVIAGLHANYVAFLKQSGAINLDEYYQQANINNPQQPGQGTFRYAANKGAVLYNPSGNTGTETLVQYDPALDGQDDPPADKKRLRERRDFLVSVTQGGMEQDFKEVLRSEQKEIESLNLTPADKELVLTEVLIHPEFLDSIKASVTVAEVRAMILMLESQQLEEQRELNKEKKKQEELEAAAMETSQTYEAERAQLAAEIAADKSLPPLNDTSLAALCSMHLGDFVTLCPCDERPSDPHHPSSAIVTEEAKAMMAFRNAKIAQMHPPANPKNN